MRMDYNGSRVPDITVRTNLSRPAVSHHLQILKDAGIVKMRKEGTMTYYYLDPDMASFHRLSEALDQAVAICAKLPDRSGGGVKHEHRTGNLFSLSHLAGKAAVLRL